MLIKLKILETLQKLNKLLVNFDSINLKYSDYFIEMPKKH